MAGWLPLLLFFALFLTTRATAAVVVTRQQQQHSKTIEKGKMVQISKPRAIVDGQAVQIRVTTNNPLHTVHIERIVACSSVDRPYYDFEYQDFASTGCRSHGYGGGLIYSTNPEDTTLTKFRVRIHGNQLFIRKRLVDVHAPVVHLEVLIHLKDEHGNLIHPPGPSWEDYWVMTSRFDVPERMLPLGKEVEAGRKKQKHDKNEEVGLAAKIEDIFGHTNEDDDDLFDLDINETSRSTMYMGHYWGEYTLSIAGSLIIIVGALILLLYNINSRVKRRMKLHKKGLYAPGKDYNTRRKQMVENQVLGWMASAIRNGVYGKSGAKDDGDYPV